MQAIETAKKMRFGSAQAWRCSNRQRRDAVEAQEWADDDWPYPFFSARRFGWFSAKRFGWNEWSVWIKRNENFISAKALHIRVGKIRQVPNRWIDLSALLVSMVLLVDTGWTASTVITSIEILDKGWAWVIVFTPAFYAYCFFSLFAAMLPLQYAINVARDAFNSELRGESHVRTFSRLLAVLITTPLFSMLMLVIAWLSFPLIGDPGGQPFVRFIPFYPWPSMHLF